MLCGKGEREVNCHFEIEVVCVHSEPIPRKGSGGTIVDFTRPLAGIGSVTSDVA